MPALAASVIVIADIHYILFSWTKLLLLAAAQKYEERASRAADNDQTCADNLKCLSACVCGTRISSRVSVDGHSAAQQPAADSSM